MSQNNNENEKLNDTQDDAAVEAGVEQALEGILGGGEVGPIQGIGLGGEPLVDDDSGDVIPPVLNPKKSGTQKKRRGFAVMDPKRVAEIAAKGGKAAHAAGTAHEFTKEEAARAGRLGGYATHAKRAAAKKGSSK